MSWVQENWPIIVGFAGGLVAWGKTTNDVAKNKEEIKTARADIGEMKDAIARIETHQEYTRTGIDEIKRELRAQRP
jgi:hypothetical protein